jgi:hypothetical protein
MSCYRVSLGRSILNVAEVLRRAASKGVSGDVRPIPATGLAACPGSREHLMGAASGVTWMVLTYFVPIVVVSRVLLIWQLYARRGEALDPALGRTPRPQAASALRTS